MPHNSPLLYVLLVPALAAGCQTTVNLTEGTATDTESGAGDTADSASDPKTTEDCVEGAVGCPCYGNKTCDDKLVCNAESLCEPLPGETTGAATGDTTGDPVGDSTGETTGDAPAKTTGDTTSGTAGSTSGDTTSDPADTTTGDTSDDTTGGDVPGCGDVPADMACVPANTFEMGTDLNTFQGWQVFPNERPAHTVTITKPFWIDRTEVTVEAYAVCWALKICELPMQGKDLNWGIAGKEKHPANGVNWYQAKKYCEWKGKRLPTEAEWELAARGDDGRMFPWGDAVPTCDHVVSNDCGTSGTGPVGSKPLGDSPYGLHDMGGNVLEWCSDYYKEDYYYESPTVDPQGPMDGTKRTYRSFGVFVYSPNSALQRSTVRVGGSPLGNDTNPAVMGFRCAQTPP